MLFNDYGGILDDLAATLGLAPKPPAGFSCAPGERAVRASTGKWVCISDPSSHGAVTVADTPADVVDSVAPEGTVHEYPDAEPEVVPGSAQTTPAGGYTVSIREGGVTRTVAAEMVDTPQGPALRPKKGLSPWVWGAIAAAGGSVLILAISAASSGARAPAPALAGYRRRRRR